MYEKNCRSIEKLYPDLLYGIEQYIASQRKSHDNNIDIIVEDSAAKDGTKITQIITNGKKQYMNSMYSPGKEAEKFAEQYRSINDFSVMLFLGLSNGIIARSVLGVLGEHVHIIFYEPSPEIFIHTINNYDITDIICDSRVSIFVREIYNATFDIFLEDAINLSNYRNTFYDALPKYRVLYPEIYDNIQTSFERSVQNQRNNIETEKHQGRASTENNIYNLPQLKNCNCEEEFRGVFPTHLPVVLVASGPSLRKNVKELAKLKGKLLIIAADTAVRYLASMGVRPDIIITADPHIVDSIYEGIEDIDTYICAYTSDVSYKTLRALENGRKIIISSRCAYYDKVLGLAGYHMYSLNNGGSVSTVAFALAQSWGYTRYILVGQDLAFQGDSMYADKDMKFGHGQILYPMEGYYGGIVQTPPDFKIYLDWYEMMAKSHPEFEIIDATEGGAKIKGTKQCPLSQIVDTYSREEYDYEKIIMDRQPLFVEDGYEKLRNYIENTVNRLGLMKNKLITGQALIQNVENSFKTGVSGIDERNINDRISQIINECADMEESFFVDELIAEKHADDIAEVYERQSDPREEYRKVLLVMKEYVRDMSEAIDEVKEMFETVLKEM